MRRVFKGLTIAVSAGIILLFSFRKHHHSSGSQPAQMTDAQFFDSVAGHYKVFDTLGNFMYEMDISHIHVDDFTDSLKFVNFDGNFLFAVEQSHPNIHPTYIGLGHHDTLYDSNHKRWKIIGVTDAYFNNMHGDSIPLWFSKSNINYWMYDLVPYYGAMEKQIAVKQHTIPMWFQKTNIKSRGNNIEVISEQ